MHAETAAWVAAKKLPFAGYSVGAVPPHVRTAFGSLKLAIALCNLQSSLPVVMGAGSHPFPFRTRKLSLLPPMVLRGKLRGRVGHCRDYFSKPASSDDGA